MVDYCSGGTLFYNFNALDPTHQQAYRTSEQSKPYIVKATALGEQYRAIIESEDTMWREYQNFGLEEWEDDFFEEFPDAKVFIAEVHELGEFFSVVKIVLPKETIYALLPENYETGEKVGYIADCIRKDSVYSLTPVALDKIIADWQAIRSEMETPNET